MSSHNIAAAALRLLALSLTIACPAFAQEPVAEPARATEAAPARIAPDPPAPPPGNMIAATAIRWPQAQAEALLAAVTAADREGLDPADFERAALEAAIAGGDERAIDAAATGSALALARAYLVGHVTDRAAFDWKIERSAYEAYALPRQLAEAVAGGRVRPWLESLLPGDPRYAALRKALAATAKGDAERRQLIAANMERWRWLPRDLGRDHLFVNVPAYRLQLVADGAVVARHDVVVGARETPTPMLALKANALVANPWWNVPESIVKSSNIRPGRASARRGYVFAQAEGGRLRVRQRPGAGNALGRLKIDMPNPHAIFLHDTNAKAAFAKPMRALSHGCVRVEDVTKLAAELMARGGGDGASVAAALAGGKTQTLKLPREWPVWLVYFTAEADADGTLTVIGDPYRRDAQLTTAIAGTRPATALAAAR